MVRDFAKIQIQNAFLWCLIVRSVSTASVVENVEVIFMLSLTNPKWFAFETVQITSLHLTQATLEAFAKSHLQNARPLPSARDVPTRLIAADVNRGITNLERHHLQIPHVSHLAHLDFSKKEEDVSDLRKMAVWMNIVSLAEKAGIVLIT